ncbi:Oxidoreductase BOA1 [Paramyrothecium foliicola]|nr:Oxidoreductase BOA1 [Paramyrothecium foliicola]
MGVIAVAGGTGDVGRTIVEQLVSSGKHEIFILARKQNSSTVPGAEVLVVDYNDTDGTANILENKRIDTVISTLPGVAADSQLQLIAAADKASTTKRFIPSEFASYVPPDATDDFTAAARQAAAALNKTGLQVTRFAIGIFMDYYGVPNVPTHLRAFVWGIDIQNRRAAIPGTGDEVWATTHSRDLARFIERLLEDEDWPEISLVSGSDVTFNQILALAKQYTGDDFEVTYDSYEKLSQGHATVISKDSTYDGLDPEYSLLVLYIRSQCWRDPTSKFFQPERAYVPGYSAHRIDESLRYVDSNFTHVAQDANPAPPELCVGIPSVKRRGISYLKSTLGSLQHGLTPEERAKIHFVVLLGHVREWKHPDYDQPWLDKMADKVILYKDDEEILSVAKSLERNRTHEFKSKFDYYLVMEECQKTNAQYTLIAEDDNVFMDGWRSRTMAALQEATTKTFEMGVTQFTYLRLFYYERLLGWNAESWPTYLAACVGIIAVVLCASLLSSRYIPVVRLHLTRESIIIITFVFTPLYILLFFSAGANCLFPQPTGVHLMSEHACCSQGLVFPQETMVNELIPLFREKRWTKINMDSLIEEYADSIHGLRWALTPVVMQHVGGRSSHGKHRDKYGKMTPKHIWNFDFELNDAASLANEH